MKILIAYSSANGTTAKCADMLAEKLKAKNEVSLVNVKDVIPAPEGFDAVILGSSVRMSKISSLVTNSYVGLVKVSFPKESEYTAGMTINIPIRPAISEKRPNRIPERRKEKRSPRGLRSIGERERCT